MLDSAALYYQVGLRNRLCYELMFNEKKAESAGNLNAYIYLITDAQLNIQNGEFVSAIH